MRTKTADPAGWAKTKLNMGNVWQDMPTGRKAANLGKAIACYEEALTVSTKRANPSDWALVKNNLGNAWSDMPTGDISENFRKAIACFEEA